MFADHVLGDIRRWWIVEGQHLIDGPTFFEVFEFVCDVGAQGQAAWSALDDVGSGYRSYPVFHGGVLPVVILLVERGEDLIVWDIRFPVSEP